MTFAEELTAFFRDKGATIVDAAKTGPAGYPLSEQEVAALLASEACLRGILDARRLYEDGVSLGKVAEADKNLKMALRGSAQAGLWTFIAMKMTEALQELEADARSTEQKLNEWLKGGS